MDPSLNPQYLVALMHKPIGHTQDAESDHPTDETTDHDFAWGKKQCTFPVLDSLASVCISEPKHQVISLALQLRSLECKIRLIIAENGEVKESLVAYVRRIWAKLQELSEKSTHQITAEGNPKEGNPRERNNFKEEPVQPSATLDLFCEILKYTRQKSINSIQEWLGDLSTFLHRLWKVRKGKLQGHEIDLRITLLASERACRVLAQESLTSEDWEMAYNAMGLATRSAEPMIWDPIGCERLVHELKDPEGNTPFLLHHALNQITSQYRHFRALVEFSHSPHLRHVFTYKMSIKSVPKSENHSIELPTSKSEWSQIINNICMEFHEPSRGWQDKEAERAKLGFKQTWKISSHCECSLIEHLAKERNRNGKGKLKGLREATGGDVGYRRLEEDATSGQRGGVSTGIPQPEGGTIRTMPDIGGGCGRLMGVEKGERDGSSEASECESNDWSRVPPFSYIGISKPSCTPCCIWIAAYNSLGQQRFYTRGSCKKWIWPWGMPRFQSQQLKQHMVNMLSKEYIQRLEQEGKLPSLSDTSANSMEADSPWNPNIIADLASLLLAENL
ncbi:hypothetical protein B9Z19DRAFT_1125367 [Tuber borchii]|uniref:Uncharacterized protein n=1 Tax=Tuber borchii TaxID=42251 RepID=A0A2T6ZV64_TUBBO|nr:hypothetical protein B9Z19DRAFT_1125367 [Tuber borchii]